MKILYGIQGTGNGHVSRAREIVPILKKFGKVDIVLSGRHSEVDLGHEIKYNFHGFGFKFGTKGNVDILKTLQDLKLIQLLKDVKKLPVKEYDLVIHDVEPITAWACKLKGKKCWEMSHQVAYTSQKTPQLKGLHYGKFILNTYTPRNHKVGFHFQAYDDFIHTPVIRSEVRRLQPNVKDYYLIYLPAYGDDFIFDLVNRFKQEKFVVFSKHCKKYYTKENVQFLKIDNDKYLNHLANCKGLITGAGFEGPSEALYLKKKLICVPMRNQFEQLCNAKAIEELGIPIVWKEKEFIPKLINFIKTNTLVNVNFPNETERIIKKIIKHT